MAKKRKFRDKNGHHVDLSRLRLSSIAIKPASPSNFLTSINLSHNFLRNLPADFNRLEFLCQLNLSFNRFSSVPESLLEIGSLSVLLLNHNSLDTLPSRLFHQCGRLAPARLSTLQLDGNNLTHIPFPRQPNTTEATKATTHSAAARSHSNQTHNKHNHQSALRRLSLARNRLMELPTELTALRLVFLDVSHNQLTALPTQLIHMTQLDQFHCSHNPLQFPPLDVCARGLPAILHSLSVLSQVKQCHSIHNSTTSAARLAQFVDSCKNVDSCRIDSELQSIGPINKFSLDDISKSRFNDDEQVVIMRSKRSPVHQSKNSNTSSDYRNFQIIDGDFINLNLKDNTVCDEATHFCEARSNTGWNWRQNTIRNAINFTNDSIKQNNVFKFIHKKYLEDLQTFQKMLNSQFDWNIELNELFCKLRSGEVLQSIIDHYRPGLFLLPEPDTSIASLPGNRTCLTLSNLSAGLRDYPDWKCRRARFIWCCSRIGVSSSCLCNQSDIISNENLTAFLHTFRSLIAVSSKPSTTDLISLMLCMISLYFFSINLFQETRLKLF